MFKSTFVMLSLAVAALGFTSVGNAAVIVQLGDIDFPSQVCPPPPATTSLPECISPEEFTAAKSLDDPDPFNVASGYDAPVSGVTPTTFAASFTFNYAPISDPITGASIVLGLYEADAYADGNQVKSFLLNGVVDLTALLNAVMETPPLGSGREELHYAVELPGAAFAKLATGTATFYLELQKGSAPGTPTDWMFNRAGLDFATLTMNVPEPGTLILLGLGLAGFAVSRRRKQ